MKKLRLLVTKKCNRTCPGCCNKDWDLDNLPICDSFDGYKEVILTGGEPMLNPNNLIYLIKEIRKESQAPIYLYTAKVDNIQRALSILFFIDGITVTIHEETDWDSVAEFNRLLPTNCRKSLRLNVFKECNLPSYDEFYKWKVKDSIEWIENCPLPTDEVFMKLGK
jgi:hypothetical protein